MERLLYLIALIMICCFGCKKDKKNGPNDNISTVKIQLVSGGNQKDTIGNRLKDSIVVKITDSGVPSVNYTIQFKRSGCEDVSITSKTTTVNGLVSYPWYLSGETGGQLLKVIVSDNSGNKKDSISVMATGLAALHGWHRGGCMQNFPVNAVSGLSSGRIFASLNKVDYPYYSDDNAASWHPLKSFTNSHFITKIVPGANNEVFVATQNEGVFYSKDNGQTWANISAGITDPTAFADFTYTKNGNLIYTNNSGVYISTDKGANWTEASYGLPDGPSYYPCEQLNGDLYVIGSDAELYKTTDGGNNWKDQGSDLGNILLESVESMFIDANGDMYIGVPSNGPGSDGSIYRSTNQGTTWSQVYSNTPLDNSYANVTQISKLGSTYYFSFAGRGVYQTPNFSTYSNITARFAQYGLLSYTLSQNSTFILGSPGFGVFYYVP